MTRKMIAVALVATATGCASAAGGPPPEKHDRIVAITESQVIRSTELSTQQSIHVNVDPDSVFTLLRAIYPAVGVEVKLYDPAKGEFGNRNFGAHYSLKGVALHNFVDCGATATGPSADSYRVAMSLVSYVFAEGNGSSVSTRLEARADDTGQSRGTVPCSSTGSLEGRVNQMLRAKTSG